jgi:hypothetical protein
MPRPALHLLAQLTEENSRNVIIGSVILVVILLIFFAGVFFYRKWMKADDTTTSTGFTLSDLRRLHKEGKMTDGEFESAKAILIGSLKKAEAKPPAGPRTDPPGFDVPPARK